MTFELSLDNSQITTYLLPKKKHVYISLCLLMNTNNLFSLIKAQKNNTQKVKGQESKPRHSLTL